MPLYQYQCSACGQIFETIATMDESNASQQCPECIKKGNAGVGFRIMSSPMIVSRLNLRISQGKQRRRIL